MTLFIRFLFLITRIGFFGSKHDKLMTKKALQIKQRELSAITVCSWQWKRNRNGKEKSLANINHKESSIKGLAIRKKISSGSNLHYNYEKKPLSYNIALVYVFLTGSIALRGNWKKKKLEHKIGNGIINPNSLSHH